MGKRMFRRKRQKAERGEFVGEPVPSGFIVPIIGHKDNGEYQYGKLQPYPPHAEIDSRILEEFVRQRGSPLKTKRALGELTFPEFPEELAYMRRLTALRGCRHTPMGYEITSRLIAGLAVNAKLAGAWRWGDTEPRLDNHEPAVSRDLFLQACELATAKKKPRGRAVNHDPLEWSGLLWCMNGDEPRPVSGHNSVRRYVCDYDYQVGRGSLCLDIAASFIDTPLSAEVLKQLDFTPYLDEVMTRMEADAGKGKLEQLQNKRAQAALEESIGKWQALLQTCVDPITHAVDREREDFYWEQTRKERARLQELQDKDLRPRESVIPIKEVREFLKRLPSTWQNYSGGLRNRLLKLIISKVEIRHGRDFIKAAIIWKMGLRQEITIHRPVSAGRREARWTDGQDELVRTLYPVASKEALLSALPGRSWKGISLRALRMGLVRKPAIKGQRPSCSPRRWTEVEDRELERLYKGGSSAREIAAALNRTSCLSTSGHISRGGRHLDL